MGTFAALLESLDGSSGSGDASPEAPGAASPADSPMAVGVARTAATAGAAGPAVAVTLQSAFPAVPAAVAVTILQSAASPVPASANTANSISPLPPVEAWSASPPLSAGPGKAGALPERVRARAPQAGPPIQPKATQADAPQPEAGELPGRTLAPAARLAASPPQTLAEATTAPDYVPLAMPGEDPPSPAGEDGPKQHAMGTEPGTPGRRTSGRSQTSAEPPPRRSAGPITPGQAVAAVMPVEPPCAVIDGQTMDLTSAPFPTPVSAGPRNIAGNQVASRDETQGTPAGSNRTPPGDIPPRLPPPEAAGPAGPRLSAAARAPEPLPGSAEFPAVENMMLAFTARLRGASTLPSALDSRAAGTDSGESPAGRSAGAPDDHPVLFRLPAAADSPELPAVAISQPFKPYSAQLAANEAAPEALPADAGGSFPDAVASRRGSAWQDSTPARADASGGKDHDRQLEWDTGREESPASLPETANAGPAVPAMEVRPAASAAVTPPASAALPASRTEAVPPPEPPRPPAVAHDIKLAVGNHPDERVELRIADRNGDVHVAVRTPDARLAVELREDLPVLAAKLEQAGFRAETWHPASASWNGPAERSGAAAPSDGSGGSGYDGTGHGDPQQQNPQDAQDSKNPTPRKDDRKDFAWLFSSLR
jgi:hypothetical protein